MVCVGFLTGIPYLLELDQGKMLYNYIKIAVRQLHRKKGYAVINLGGLSLGMAVVMFVGLWMHDELSFNQCHENYGSLVQVMQHRTLNDVRTTGMGIPRPLEFTLRDAYGSDFKYLSMCTWTGDNILTAGNRSISKSGNYFRAIFRRCFL